MWVLWIDIALTGALTAGLYRLAAQQRRDERAESRKKVLAQRIGYAHGSDLASVVQQLPKPRREPRGDRRARLRRLRKDAKLSFAELRAWHDFETQVFTLQPSGVWTVEELWDTQPAAFDACAEAAVLYAIDIGEVRSEEGVRSLEFVMVLGDDYVVVTRLAAPPPLIIRCIERLQGWASLAREHARRLRRKLAAPPPALILHAQRREICWYPRRRFEAPHGTATHHHPTSTHPPRPARTIRSR